MKLKTLAVGLCTIALLAGCGSKGDDAGKSEKEDKTIRIGASVTPHAEIIRHIQPVLEKEGYTLDIKEYTDYNKMNQALADDDMAANFFQHQQFLDNWTKNANAEDKITSVFTVHYEPMGIYSVNHKSLKELADGQKIAVPHDSTNGGRALMLLQENGIITLKKGKGIDATKQDIKKYNKKVEIVEMDATACATSLPDVDFSVINGNNALLAKVSDKVMASESKDSEATKSFANVIVVQTAHKDDEKIKALIKALNTEDVKKFIEDNYDGIVVPLVPVK